uniref:TerB domain-containing protein n=1 Tax=Ascaris lumbricoides TaxID=6252 RepID=A0A0M3I4A8_ASCLU
MKYFLQISQLCTEAEAIAANSFLDAEQSSAHIVRLVAMNLTNEEKDLINLWENLNDTLSERIFFLNKYENLPKDQYEQLTKSFSDVLNKFVTSDLKRSIASFLARLTLSEQNDLKMFGEKFDEEKLVTLIDDKLKEDNISVIERDEIRDYLKKLFMTNKST